MDIHEAIGKLPRPRKGFVLPGHKYTGPYNPLNEQLDENDLPIVGQEPFNTVDAISMKHDICYRDHSNGKKKCDDQMILELDDLLEPKNLREKIDRKLVRNIIATKRRLGWGIEWSNALADELHKPIKRKFQKRLVFAKNVDEIWAADLVDMQSFAKFNNGYKYILMAIDVFSKYGWAVPIKTKSGIAVADALKKILRDSKPAMLWTDKGKEFYNISVARLLKKNGIKLYSTENEEKASVVERWNRTIKTLMWKYFSANNTNRYIDILEKLIEKYNDTKHRTIGCTPRIARQPSSYERVFKKLYEKQSKERRQNIIPHFQIGDTVRISKKKKTFEKGFTPNWTEELFTIRKVKETKPPTYTIQDFNGDPIEGSFYGAELQKSTQDVYRIDKVLKQRTRKSDGEKEALVKWKGYDNKFNSWVPLKDLQKLKQ